MMSVLGIPRSSVRLPAPLATIIPKHRRRAWTQLQKTLGLRLPDLVRPRWVTESVVVAVSLVVAATFFLVVELGMWTALPMWGILGVACLVSFVFYQATESLAVEFRLEFATIGGLAKALLQKNHAAISDEFDRVNADEVWETLRALIVAQLDVPLSDVTKEANFVKNLGLT